MGVSDYWPLSVLCVSVCLCVSVIFFNKIRQDLKKGVANVGGVFIRGLRTLCQLWTFINDTRKMAQANVVTKKHIIMNCSNYIYNF